VYHDRRPATVESHYIIVMISNDYSDCNAFSKLLAKHVINSMHTRSNVTVL